MTILDLQRRIAEVGRIRIGEQVPVGRSSSKTRPRKLDTFRLTSADRLRIEQAARLYGGEAKPWKAPSGPQWEVITAATTLPVIVPPSEMAYSVWYEMWSAGGCQRRCDGQTDSISDGPCLCDPDRRDCAVHTRLSVMLADLPGLGVWRIDTSGWYASSELSAAVEVVRMAGEAGIMLPGRLRLDQRMVKRIVDGKPSTFRFAVPVLDVDVTPAQLLGGDRRTAPPGLHVGQPAELATARPALEAAADGGPTHEREPASPSLTPVPASVQERPAGSVADQFARVAEPVERPRRRNAAQPVPATGLAPRTVAQASADQRGLETGPQPPTEQSVQLEGPEPPPGEAGNGGPARGEADGPPDPDRPGSVTDEQMKKMFAVLGELAVRDRDERLYIQSMLAGRTVTSSLQLTLREASHVIDQLEDCLQQEIPLRALDQLLTATAATGGNGEGVPA